MRICRLTDTDPQSRVSPDGDVTHGTLFVGDDGVVRWFSAEALLAMRGVGLYKGGHHGYDAFEVED